MPKVSVVVATYNRHELLVKMLGDLVRQDVPASDFEVVLVDDGSITPARAFLEVQSWPFALRIFEQENAGQAAARDRGVRAAEASVIVVIDDDMELPPHFLSAHLAQHDAGFEVVLGHIRASPDLRKRPLFERFHAKFTDGMIDTGRRGEAIRGAWLCTGNVSFRRDAYVAVGGFDRALARSEDRDLGIRFEESGARITFAEMAYTTHHSDHESLEVWLRRARLYGVYDSRIAKKHARLAYVDPWRFLFEVNPLSRPLLLLAITVPPIGHLLSKAAMATSQALDARGLESVAIRGTTLVYGLEYFLGVRDEAGSLLASFRNLARYVRKAITAAPSRKH
jgi:GT2 family glycosyltransferase